MRLAFNDCGLIELDGRVIGVNLGFDFCAEHEWGFEWAAAYLGRPARPSRTHLGVAARTTTRHLPAFPIELAETKAALWLRGSQGWRAEDTTLAQDVRAGANKQPQYVSDMVRRDRPIVAAWDGRSGFCVKATSDDAKAGVHAAYEALTGDRCLIIQTGGVFGGGGLKLIDRALVPQSTDDEMRAIDTSTLNLQDAISATGIHERLAAAGLRFYALFPRWISEADGSYEFWLNPRDQRQVNDGWFTLADLEAWIAGTGPIPITS